MAAGPTGRSRLVKVVAIDHGFPFHGSFTLREGGKKTGDQLSLLHSQKHAWIYPEARAQLGIKLGQDLQLGETKFRINDLIIEESGLAFQPTDLAPKVFISRTYLEETNLLGAGSLAYHTHLFRLPEGADIPAFGRGLERVLDSPEILTPTGKPVTGQAGYCGIFPIFYLWFPWLLCFLPVSGAVFFFMDF